METDNFNKLTEQERGELALCGITTPEQLLRTDVETLLNDLKSAKTFFPDKTFTITRERLETICGQVPSKEESSETDAHDIGLTIQKEAPAAVFHRSRQERNHSDQKVLEKNKQRMMHSSVRTSHPIKSILAAFSTLLLVVPAISVFVLPFMMATNALPETPIIILAFGLIIAPSLPYLLFSRLALCPVCHIRIFNFSDYSRNRLAHRIPGLGYNITTALHIIFRFKYICPGCGTPVRLVRKKGSH